MEKNLPFQTIRPLPPPIRVPSRLWATFVQTPIYSEKSGITALTFKPLAF